jgi:hypothetical protein
VGVVEQLFETIPIGPYLSGRVGTVVDMVVDIVAEEASVVEEETLGTEVSLQNLVCIDFAPVGDGVKGTVTSHSNLA